MHVVTRQGDVLRARAPPCSPIMRMRSLQSAIRDAAPWLAVTAIIGGVDYVTPPTYAFASIYFIPIFPAAWRS